MGARARVRVTVVGSVEVEKAAAAAAVAASREDEKPTAEEATAMGEKVAARRRPGYTYAAAAAGASQARRAASRSVLARRITTTCGRNSSARACSAKRVGASAAQWPERCSRTIATPDSDLRPLLPRRCTPRVGCRSAVQRRTSTAVLTKQTKSSVPDCGCELSELSVEPSVLRPSSAWLTAWSAAHDAFPRSGRPASDAPELAAGCKAGTISGHPLEPAECVAFLSKRQAMN